MPSLLRWRSHSVPVLHDGLVRLTQDLKVTRPDFLEIGDVVSPPLFIDLDGAHGDISDEDLAVLDAGK